MSVNNEYLGNEGYLLMGAAFEVYSPRIHSKELRERGEVVPLNPAYKRLRGIKGERTFLSVERAGKPILR